MTEATIIHREPESILMVETADLGVYFAHPQGRKFSDPVEAWHQLLSLFGVKARAFTRDGIQRHAMIPGWVLRNLDLKIRRGEVVFLMGPSGSGKSVLLRVLSRAVPPSEGKVRLTGEISGLLSIGDNLDVRLTAKENIRLFQRFSGRPPADFADYAREVIEFAGLGGFEDVPVRTYSTGMVMRLSIALVMHGTPDVLLIDDVLGVGDIEFRQKCMERLHNLKEQGCTMLVVTDDDMLVRQLATRVVTLGAGEVISDDVPRAWFSPRYETGTRALKWNVQNQLPFNEIVALKAIRLSEVGGSDANKLRIEMEYHANVSGLTCRPLVDVMNGKVVLWRSLYPDRLDISAPGLFQYWVELPHGYLKRGTYKIALGLVIEKGNCIYSLKAQDVVTLQVMMDSESISNPQCMLNVPCHWEVGRLGSA